VEERNAILRLSDEDKRNDKDSEQQALRELKKLKEMVDMETEAFISNIPFDVDAASLVKFINEIIGMPGVVVRCQIIEKQHRRIGCALVLFKNRVLFDKFSRCPALILKGRPLRVKEGNGQSKNRRRVKEQDSLFHAQKLQLGIRKLFPANHTLIEWETSSISQMRVDSARQILVICFSVENKNHRAEISIKHMREVHMERHSETNTFVLVFRLRQRPHLFAKPSEVSPSPLNFTSDLFDFGFENTLAQIMAGFQSSLLWELDADENDEDLVRTIDPTQEQAFSRCQVFHVFMGINEEEVFRLLRLLRKRQNTLIDINPTPRELIRNNSKEKAQNLWFALHSKRLAFSTLYWLDCLVGANKLDLFSLQQDDITHTHNKLDSNSNPCDNQERSALWRTMSTQCTKKTDSILQELYLDPKIIFIENLAESFFERLAIINSMREENADGEESADNTEYLVDSVMVRRVFVTPLAICPQPAELDTSNRIIRHFQEHIDRFVRVTFVDEDFGSILQAASDIIYENRLRTIVHTGITVAGHSFVFLAFSNSQIREHSCWFYDESPRLGDSLRSPPPKAQDIRNWVGDLSQIQIIGKHAARLGQAFSDTVPATTVQASEFYMDEDVQRHGFCFSDGVGKISQSYADQIRDRLGLDTTPSAFQIRFGGMKGVLSVVPDHFLSNGRHLAFRPSMNKFQSNHRELEINNYSKPIPCYLNRQIITVLSARGIPDEVFMDLLEQMTQTLELSLVNNSDSLSLIEKNTHIGRGELLPMNGAWCMLQAGFQVSQEPYLHGLLLALRNRLILDLQTRARICIHNGVCLIGILDETSTLQEGEVFVQLSDKFGGSPWVLQSPKVVVGRSPALHPGDVRVLIPKDIPELHHLVDVVVFPANGARPHPNEMSGGDLDGDIYFVIWDQNLIPLVDFPPMIYATTNAPAKTSPSVNINDIANFFVDYIKNDNLGQIANSHLVHADFSHEGARCQECLQLAQLHSTAVDFLKTGIPAVFPRELRTKRVPSFMSSSRFKQTYESVKFLGKIHKICTGVRNNKSYPVCADRSLLVPGYEQYLEDSLESMNEYNEHIMQLMKHYGVYDEMELLSGCVLKFTRQGSERGTKGGSDLQSRLNKAVQNVRSIFRDRFLEDFTITESQMNEASNILSDIFNGVNTLRKIETESDAWKLMRKASAWYFCAYNQDNTDQSEYPPLISFAWIAWDVLCVIKTTFSNY